MKPPPDPRYRHRFPAEIISHAVWLYHVFRLSCHVRFQGVRTQKSIRFFFFRLNFADAGMHGGGRALSDG
jgi:hypothetical protein